MFLFCWNLVMLASSLQREHASARHGRRSARSTPLAGEGNHHQKMLQPRRGGATSVGPEAATSQTNNGTGNGRAATATAAVDHCWNQLLFLLEPPLSFAGTAFFVATIN
ncbi:hypothetical protein VPH35_015555 [Triticum aestivum]